MRLTFLTPHTRVGSGGVKVIFRMAQGMQEVGFAVSIVSKKKLSGNLEFLLGKRPTFPIDCIDQLPGNLLPDTDCLIMYADNEGFDELPGAPKVLFLQGFGTQNYELETENIAKPYNLVISTSKWLEDVARNFGHQTYLVHPGIDSFFKPVAVPKIGMTMLGTLYHASPLKNTSGASATFARVYSRLRGNVKAIYLSSSIPEDYARFGEMPFVYSFLINPPQRLLPAMYSSCDAWVSASTNEGFGLTPLEAMACGTPVVTCLNKGLDQYLSSGRNCMLAERPDGMAEAVINLLHNEALRKRVVSGGIELARRFTWERAISKFREALATIGITP